MDFSMITGKNYAKRILVKKYSVPDDVDAYLVIPMQFKTDCIEAISWVTKHLDYDPIDVEEQKDFFARSIIIAIFFNFKNKEDAVEFLLANEIEA